MKKVISWLRSTTIGKVLTAFLAGILLFVSTACNSSDVLAKTADQVREEVPSQAITSKYKGGMNDYSDVDPRANTSGLGAKTKGLIDNANRNMIDMTDDLGTNTDRTLDKKSQNLNEFNRNVDRSTDHASNKAQNSTRDFVEGARRGSENLKENVKNAPGSAANTVRGAGENAKNATEDLSGASYRAGDNFKTNAEVSGQYSANNRK